MGKMVPPIRPGSVLRRASGIEGGHWRERLPRPPFLVLWVEDAGRSIPYARSQHVHTAVWAAVLDRGGGVAFAVARSLSLSARARVLELEASDASRGRIPCP